MAKKCKTADVELAAKIPASQEEQDAPEVTQASRSATVEDFQAAFQRLRQRANRGDRQAKEALVRYLDADPSRWAVLGDMARHAEMSMIQVVTDGEWLAGEAIKREAARLRERLSRPNQLPLEELAVTRLAGCWLQLQFIESMCHRAEGDFVNAKFWLGRQQQVHRLYAQAEKSLLLIRSLLPGATLPQIPAPQIEANTVAPQRCVETVARADISEETSPVPSGVNRMAQLAAGTVSSTMETLAGETVNNPPRVNGYHHRLKEFLVPADS